MKVDPNINQSFRDVIDQSFAENNNTTIFWYGDNFSDLPNAVTTIVAEVKKKREYSINQDDWNTLCTFNTSNESDDIFKQALSRHINDARYMGQLFFQICQKSTDTFKDIEIITSTPGFIMKVGYVPEFWKYVNVQYGNLQEPTKKNLVSAFKQGYFSLPMVDAFEVYKKLKAEDLIYPSEIKFIDDENAQTSDKNLNFEIKNFLNYDFSNDSELAGKWLTYLIIRRNNNGVYGDTIYGKNRLRDIKLTSDLMEQLIASFPQKQLVLFSEFEVIINDEDVYSLFYKLLKDNYIINGDERILDKFPDELLKVPLIQRFLVNIDNDNELKPKLLKQLIDEIDFGNKVFGSELNQFVENHSDIITDFQEGLKYQDGIKGSKIMTVDVLKSRITTDDVNDLTDDELLNKLNNFDDPIDSDISTPKTIDFMMNVLNKANPLQLKFKNFILENGSQIITNYRELFVKIYIEMNDDELVSMAKNLLLTHFELDHYGYDVNQLMMYELEHRIEIENNEFISKLLTVNANTLETKSGFNSNSESNPMDLNYFINSELGRYLDALIKITKKTSLYDGQICDVIEGVEEADFRDFTIGAIFLKYSQIKPVNDSNMNIFQGYSYSYSGFSTANTAFFKQSVIEILTKGLVNDFNQRNVFIMMLIELVTSDFVEGIAWEKINFSRLISISLETQDPIKNEVVWLNELLAHDSDSKYLNVFIIDLQKENILDNKVDLAIEVIKANIEKITKVGTLSFTYAITKKADEVQRAKLIDLFLMLFENGKFNLAVSGIQDIESIIPSLSNEQNRQIRNSKQLDEFLTPVEVDIIKHKLDIMYKED